jgi:hypothetical protein
MLQKEAFYGVDAGASCCADERYGATQLLRESQRIDSAAARLHQIRHVE